MLHPSESKFQHGCRARHNHIAHKNPRRENSEYRGQYGNAGGCVTEVNSVHVTSYTFTVHPHQPENRIQDARSKNVVRVCPAHDTERTRALSASRLSARCSCATLGYTFHLRTHGTQSIFACKLQPHVAGDWTGVDFPHPFHAVRRSTLPLFAFCFRTIAFCARRCRPLVILAQGLE